MAQDKNISNNNPTQATGGTPLTNMAAALAALGVNLNTSVTKSGKAKGTGTLPALGVNEVGFTRLAPNALNTYLSGMRKRIAEKECSPVEGENSAQRAERLASYAKGIGFAKTPVTTDEVRQAIAGMETKPVQLGASDTGPITCLIVRVS